MNPCTKIDNPTYLNRNYRNIPTDLESDHFRITSLDEWKDNFKSMFDESKLGQQDTLRPNRLFINPEDFSKHLKRTYETDQKLLDSIGAGLRVVVECVDEYTVFVREYERIAECDDNPFLFLRTFRRLRAVRMLAEVSTIMGMKEEDFVEYVVANKTRFGMKTYLDETLETKLKELRIYESETYEKWGNRKRIFKMVGVKFEIKFSCAGIKVSVCHIRPIRFKKGMKTSVKTSLNFFLSKSS